MALWHILLLAAIAVLAPLAMPWLGFVFTLAIGKGLAALGVAMLLRGGLISIGHALFVAVGAYATAFLMRSAGVHDFLLLLVLVTAITTASGLLVGVFMVRYRAIFFAMLNLAISMVFFTLLSKLYHVTGGTDGLRVPTPTLFGAELSRPAFETVLQYGAVLIMMAAALIVDRYQKSPLGEAFSAVHTNEVRLQYLGLSVPGIILVAYTASAALAGLGGVITAVAIGHVVPELSYWTLSGQLVLVAVLGGIGGAPGAFIGAFFLELVRTFAAGYAADMWNAIIGVALLVVIFTLPEGLYGLLQRLKGRSAAS